MAHTNSNLRNLRLISFAVVAGMLLSVMVAFSF